MEVNICIKIHTARKDEGCGAHASLEWQRERLQAVAGKGEFALKVMKFKLHLPSPSYLYSSAPGWALAINAFPWSCVLVK